MVANGRRSTRKVGASTRSDSDSGRASRSRREGQSVTQLGISCIAFTCVVGATLVGLFLHDILPKDHLSDDSKDTVKLGMGMVATLAALVLGLLIGFATNSFNNMRSEIQQTAANIILLDRVMANYGVETKEIRDLLRQTTLARIESIWSEGCGFTVSGLLGRSVLMMTRTQATSTSQST